MKRIILIGFLSFFGITAQAAFLDSGSTARSTALGGAYSVMGEDSGLVFHNPAALANVRKADVVMDYSRLSVGMSDSSEISRHVVSGALPLKHAGTIALGWASFDMDELYNERVLAASYGQRWGNLSWGGTVKQLHVAYEPPNQVVDDYGNIQSGTPDLFQRYGTGKTAYSSDMGVIIDINAYHRVGVTIQDLNEPNIALSDDDTDRVSRTARVAWAYRPRPQLQWALAGETRDALAGQRDWIGTGAVEKKWMGGSLDPTALRASFTCGSRAQRRLALGGTYGLGSLSFDYTFVMPLGGLAIGQTAGDHRFSVRYTFGGSAPVKPVVASVPEAVSLKQEEPASYEIDEIEIVVAAQPQN